MASDFFLQIDGIKGESNDKDHKDTIEIESFSWGVSNASTARAGATGAGAGKASFQDIHFSAQASKASPSLFLACASGMHFKKAVLSVRKNSENSASSDYYQIALGDLLVSSYNAAGSDGGDFASTPADQFSLNFSNIQFSFTSQNPDGSAGSPVTVGWDLSRNSKA